MNLVRELRHLVARFFGSLSRAEPTGPLVAWLTAKLSAQEVELFEAMSVADRRHAVVCAVKAEELLGEAATDEIVVASALHDVGKTDAHLGSVGRAGATVVGRVVSPLWLERWGKATGWRRSVAIYADHDVLGSEILRSCGSAPLVVAWAREHHLAEADWSIPRDLGRSLAKADLVSSSHI